MPESNNGSDRPVPPALPAEEKVTLPPTEAERRKARFAKAEKESDDERSQRRAKELSVHFDTHMANVQEAHDTHPAPLTRNFQDWTPEEQNNWNERSKLIASANRAYHLAVKRTFAEHAAEDHHIQRVRASKQEQA